MAIGRINHTNRIYEQLSSMKKLNRAADNAAGLAIVQGMKSQTAGYDMGTRNARDGQSLLKTAEGGLSSIHDSLQRIRELSVQAGNSIYSDTERSYIQDEINQLKQSITSSAKNTEFNTKKLLDGSQADLNLATNPDGTGMKIQLDSAALDSLGIADYDVTSGNFDISDIDKAIEMVSSQRASIGASYNALDSTIAYNNLASQNLTSAFSKIEDLDVGAAVSDMKRQEVMDEYKLFVQKAMTDQQAKTIGIFTK